MGIAKDFAINETSALVASPFVNLNSSIAWSLVNPLFVICFIVSSEKDVDVEAVGGLGRCWWWLFATRKNKNYYIQKYFWNEI